MKRTFLRWLVLGLQILFSVWALLAPVTAQQAPKFKEGDRIELDIIETSDPSKAIWKKGTITKVDLGVSKSYTVQLDPLPGQLPKIMQIPIRLGDNPPLYSGPERSIGWLRSAGGAAPKVESDKLRVDENGTVLADRELVDCENLSQPKARNGTPPPTELAKKLIQCVFEKPSEPGKDGATTVDITEFAAGAPHRWNPNEDLGSGATINTIVYPFRVKWNQKSFYHTFNRVETGIERIFTCYVDVDKWHCGQAQSLKDGQKKLVQVK